MVVQLPQRLKSTIKKKFLHSTKKSLIFKAFEAKQCRFPKLNFFRILAYCCALWKKKILRRKTPNFCNEYDNYTLINGYHILHALLRIFPQKFVVIPKNFPFYSFFLMHCFIFLDSKYLPPKNL